MWVLSLHIAPELKPRDLELNEHFPERVEVGQPFPLLDLWHCLSPEPGIVAEALLAQSSAQSVGFEQQANGREFSLLVCHFSSPVTEAQG
jgi:hypothetical protein